jgi:hypothetical protein
MEKQSETELLYIVGHSRSGSTLLDMLLGNHSKMVSVGEFKYLTHYVRDAHPCSCGRLVHKCPFWTAVASQARDPEDAVAKADVREILASREVMSDIVQRPVVNVALSRALMVSGIRPPWWLSKVLIGGGYSSSIENSLSLFRAIRTAHKASIIVESTKDIGRMKLYYLRSVPGLKILYLVRDGRGVCASYMRRTECSMSNAARVWRDTNSRIKAASRGIPPGQLLMVRYEDLCRETEAELRRICSWIGSPFELDMLRLAKEKTHLIAGNPMRHRHSDKSIILDERWRAELKKEDLDEFERIAGSKNKSFGYI